MAKDTTRMIKEAEEFASVFPFDNNEQAIAEYAFKQGAKWQRRDLEAISEWAVAYKKAIGGMVAKGDPFYGGFYAALSELLDKLEAQ